MDREGLQFELIKYKKYALRQYEMIKLLKVEILKIKKLAALKDQKDEQKVNPAWVTNQDANLIQPKDHKALKEDLIFLKEALNKAEEEKKILKANADKYERRAKYTLEKFQEIKAKELQLIQIGEDKMKGSANLVEQKYKKKLEKVNSRLKELEDENNALKLKKSD